MTSHHHTHHVPIAATQPMAIDPVCGMSVNTLTSKLHSEYQGSTYYFCGPSCRTKFIANPTKYLGDAAPVEPMAEGTIFTCPMHPQIRQVGPGSCPICGMALEPETVTLDSGPNPELAEDRKSVV